MMVRRTSPNAIIPPFTLREYGMAEFIAYIDESGDESVGKGSRWFVLAAVVVESGQNGSALGQLLIGY